MIWKMQPQAVVDAILAKRNTGTLKDMAPLTVALGHGFYAGKDVDYVIETKRGHQPGRVIAQGSALPNTGVPGMIAGYGAQRDIHWRGCHSGAGYAGRRAAGNHTGRFHNEKGA